MIYVVIGAFLFMGFAVAAIMGEEAARARSRRERRRGTVPGFVALLSASVGAAYAISMVGL